MKDEQQPDLAMTDYPSQSTSETPSPRARTTYGEACRDDVAALRYLIDHEDDDAIIGRLTSAIARLSATSEAPPPAETPEPGLEQRLTMLQRYGSGGYGAMVARDGGGYVAWSDVVAAIEGGLQWEIRMENKS